MNSTAGTPLVSIVVRTMGRPLLSRALASIAAQTWRPLEIVLVDAAGLGMTHLEHEGIPVRVVDRGPLDRARAANAGLESARGDWLLFLDEDDEIEPEHTASLLEAARSSGLAVAYAQARLVDAAGRTQRLLGGPFHREALLRSNYLVIHAVLFSRRFVDEGVRFDETFAAFEDWDFWLQLAARADFAFSGRATAIYHVETGGSGAGGGANLDRGAALAQRERILRKWLPPGP